MPEERESERRRAKTKTLVRGPDGELWLLSKAGAPHQLEPQQIAKIEKILTKTEKELSNEFEFLGHGIHIGHDVFDGHGVHCEAPDMSD